jgi:hypothetical protein
MCHASAATQSHREREAASENSFSTKVSTMWNLLALFLGVVGNSAVLAVSVGSDAYSSHALVSAFPATQADREWLLRVAADGGRCELFKAPKINTGRPTDLFCAEPNFMEQELRSRGMQNNIVRTEQASVMDRLSREVYQVEDFKSYAR